VRFLTRDCCFDVAVVGGCCWWLLLVAVVGGCCWWLLLVAVVGGCCFDASKNAPQN